MKGKPNVQFELNNGAVIPLVGYGTYLTPPSQTESLVRQALDIGYRHIDTAQNYGNEHEVGLAVNRSGIPRDEIFVTSKTQTTGYPATINGIEKSLKRLGLDYIDLMLIHWPNFDNSGTYKALEEAYRRGLVRSIGVSNFNANQLSELLEKFEVKPAVDQIETHPFWQQTRMHNFLQEHNIAHESWSPFGEGMDNIFNNKILVKIGENHGKSPAQVILRFLTQNNVIVIPKSTDLNHMVSNLDIFDFELTKEEINLIRSLNQNKSYSGWPSSMQEI